jgi:hypothetical protein
MQSRFRRSTRSALLLIGVITLIVAGLLVLSGGVVTPVAPATTSVILEEEPTHRVFVENQRGDTLWVYDVWMADTPRERYQGLSDTDTLPRDHSLLFVYDQETDRRIFVMRGMRYPIDIVFIDGTGTVTAVHSAVSEPGTAEADLTRYAGRARWVLEIPHRSVSRAYLSARSERGDPSKATRTLSDIRLILAETEMNGPFRAGSCCGVDFLRPLDPATATLRPERSCHYCSR